MAFAPYLRASPTQLREARKRQGTGSMRNTASKADKAASPTLLSYHQMPQWFRQESNQWVLQSYRPIVPSLGACIRSWFYIHNESVNIYSHLLPAVFFFLCECYIQQYLTSRYSGVTGADIIGFSIFMSTAVMCLSSSAMYHTLMNHSQRVEHLCLRMDMLGVVIFILGDLTLGIQMVFWCEPLPRNTYWFMVS